LPPAICLQPGPGPLPLSFTDVTAELGLGPDALNATATLVSIADIDGDHWPDVMLTKPPGGAVSGREDPAAPTGAYHLLRNVGGKSFEDVTWSCGLFQARDGTMGRATTFVVWADVDNDGDTDALSAVYTDYSNGTKVLDATSVFLNNGDGTFTIGPDQKFTNKTRDPISGASFLDYDRNGILDLFVGHTYTSYGSLSSTIQDTFYAGDGFGFFNDVTTAAGLETQPFSSSLAASGKTHKPTWGVTSCDLDGDGWPDLMTSTYGRQFNALYRNLGNGTFEDLSLSSGFAHDANEDYSDNYMYQCFCRAHPTEPSCAGAIDPGQCPSDYDNNWVPGVDDQPWRLGGNNSVEVCGDVDNDGDMDVLNVGIAHDWAGQSADHTELLINEGFPAQPFVRPGREATGLVRPHGSSWNEGDLGGAMADFDNDGRLDLLVASSDYPDTTSLLWQQQADGKFLEVGAAVGAQIARAHGVGVVDIDRDGDYDIVLGTSLMRWDNPPADAYVYVLRNNNGQDANKLMFHLVGSGPPDGANVGAVGARITVQAGGQTFVREVQGGYGLDNMGQDPLIIMGLGENCTAEQVTVRWPNTAGDETTFHDVMANYVLVIEEGKDLAYESLEQYAPATP